MLLLFTVPAIVVGNPTGLLDISLDLTAILQILPTPTRSRTTYASPIRQIHVQPSVNRAHNVIRKVQR